MHIHTDADIPRLYPSLLFTCVQAPNLLKLHQIFQIFYSNVVAMGMDSSITY